MALETITEINLDINQPGLSVVHAKQYDTVRQVKAHLFYNGVQWNVPASNYFAMVAFKKADRIGGFYDITEAGETAITVDSNDRSIVYILLDRNLLTTVGNVSTEVTFYDTNTNGRLTTFSFVTQVEAAAVTELDLASNPYFAILGEQIHNVLEAQEAMTGVTATASKVAPGGSVTPITVTGGPGTGNPYSFGFKIPTFAGITASATAGDTAGVTVSGGTSGTSKYNLAFTLPKGDKGDKPTPVSYTFEYAVSTSGTSIPSSWSQVATPVNGKYYWIKATITWDNNQTTSSYSVGYIGMNGTGSTASEIIASSNLTVQEELDDKILVLDIPSFSSLPRLINNSRITMNHIVAEAILGTPSAQTGDWTVVTTNGQVAVAGTISGSTTLKLVLVKATSIQA